MELRKLGVVFVVLAAVLASVLPAAGPAGARHLAWSADFGLRLEGVSAESATDVWAVGVTPGENQEPAIVHWNGTGLSQIPTNLAAPGQVVPGELHGVSADSPRDAWAVGWVSPPRTHMIQSLVLRWDGSRWARVPSPNQSPLENDLKAVRANGPTDVWVLGEYLDTRTHRHRQFVIRWDGRGWSTVQLPAGVTKQIGASGFTSFAPTGPTNAFALKRHTVRVGHGAIESDEVLHWNGRSWAKAGPFFGAALFGVGASSGSDAWAVGYNCVLRNCPPFHTATYHWDGRHWKGGVFYKRGDPFTGYEVIPSPSENNSKLLSVTESARSDVWATGTCSGACPNGRNFLLHWNGGAWARVTYPGGSPASPVSSVSGSDAWVIAAGALLHWDGVSWSRK